MPQARRSRAHADLKFRMYQDPKLNDKLDHTNQPGATSELWRETSAIDCLVFGRVAGQAVAKN